MTLDPIYLSACELAAAIREGRISAGAALEAHLAQANRHQGALNAVVTRDEGAARRRAAEADAALARQEIWGPLHGVPVTVKDALETKDLRTTASFPRLARHVPSRDATVVERLRNAGAIIWGKTNMPPLAMDFQCQSPLFGRTNNPYDTQRTPGGSSGGAAAAVASGITPFEIGSDLGGSIRIPSHFCGVFGLKPTDHAVPLSGHIPDLPGTPRGVRHMGCIGPLARSVADLRLVFSLIAGPDGRDFEVPPVPLGPSVPRAVASLRIAWTDDFGGLRPSRETQDSQSVLAAKLAAAGARVDRTAPAGFDYPAAWSAWGELVGAQIGGSLPLPIRLLFQAQFFAMAGHDRLNSAVVRGAAFSLRALTKTLAVRDALAQTLDQFLTNYDVWICPVAAVPAIVHTKPGQLIPVDQERRPYLSALGAFTTVFNLTGHPVVVVPVGRTKAGLPLGVQLVGRRFHDMALLDAAEAITEVSGAFQRPAGF